MLPPFFFREPQIIAFRILHSAKAHFSVAVDGNNRRLNSIIRTLMAGSIMQLGGKTNIITGT